MFTTAANAIEQSKSEADRVEEKIEQKALEAEAQENTKPSVAEAAVAAKIEEGRPRRRQNKSHSQSRNQSHIQKPKTCRPLRPRQKNHSPQN